MGFIWMSFLIATTWVEIPLEFYGKCADMWYVNKNTQHKIIKQNLELDNLKQMWCMNENTQYKIIKQNL